MEHVNGWCFRGIYKGGLWEDDLHVSARIYLANDTEFRAFRANFYSGHCRLIWSDSVHSR